jgi:hypothetical protein
MIRINDDWVIDVDEHNYILKKDLHKTELSRDKKKMVPAYAVKSYHPSLLRALERLHEEIIRDRLREPDRCLAEACGAIRECTDEWRELARQILEDNNG